MARRLCLSSLLLCLTSRSSAAGRCYYPNGAESVGNFPCDADADEGPCCHGGLGWACLSNKLCRGPDGNVIRGSCSDPTWESPECAHFCLSANTGGTDLISCSNVTRTDTSYCCDHTVNCCNSGVGRFDVFPSAPEVVATWNRQSSQYIMVQTVTQISSASSDLSSSTTHFPSTVISPSTTPLAETTSDADASEATSIFTEPQIQNGFGLSTGAKAGIGAGAGIGVLLVAAIIYLLWKLRRNKHRAEMESATALPQPSNHQDNSASQMYGDKASTWNSWYASDGKEAGSESRAEMDGRPHQPQWVRAELPADPWDMQDSSRSVAGNK